MLVVLATVGFVAYRSLRENTQVAAPEIPAAHMERGPLLVMEEPVLHGRIVALRGHTQPDAMVMVNSSAVPVIFEDGSFSFFTPPLPAGSNTLTVTAQNPQGKVKTVRITVMIE